MGGEIVTVHLGQAGVQMSHALWEIVCIEHGVNSAGEHTDEGAQADESSAGRDYVFREALRGKFVPRTLLVDLEPTVIDEVRCGAYRNLWHPLQLINGKEDAASNFARGYYSQSRFEMSDVMDRVRILVEQCDNMTCFKLLYSANGGTGSGLTSALCERLSDEYGKKNKFATTVYPSPGYSELMVEPYNALLHSSTNLTFCDCVIITDNEAMLNVVEDALKIHHNGFTVPNRVVANAIATQFLSHRYKFIGQQHSHVDEMLINLVPYPRIHFPMMAFAPFIGPCCHQFERSSAVDLVRSVFNDTNQLLSVSAVRRAYISCCLLFRGPISPLEASNAIGVIKGDRLSRARFVDWCPTGFKVGINFAPPVQAPDTNTVVVRHSSLSMIAGNLSVRDVWTGLGRRFDQLYEKRAFVHWYVAEGMEEGEFTLAREVIQQLVEDYEAIAKDAEGTFMDTSMNHSQNHMSNSAPMLPIVKRGPKRPMDANINQVTTLDDQNSIRTLENNEDNLSLDTNQHHSDVNNAEGYRFTRIQNNNQDNDNVMNERNLLSQSRRLNIDPRTNLSRRRRLRFPELQHHAHVPEAYKAERNQMSSNALWEPKSRKYLSSAHPPVTHCGDQSTTVRRVQEGFIPYRNYNIYTKTEPNQITNASGQTNSFRSNVDKRFPPSTEFERQSSLDRCNYRGRWVSEDHETRNHPPTSHVRQMNTGRLVSRIPEPQHQHQNQQHQRHEYPNMTESPEYSMVQYTNQPSLNRNVPKYANSHISEFSDQREISPNSLYRYGSLESIPEMRNQSERSERNARFHHRERSIATDSPLRDTPLGAISSLRASSQSTCLYASNGVETPHTGADNLDHRERHRKPHRERHNHRHQQPMDRERHIRHSSFSRYTNDDSIQSTSDDTSELTQMTGTLRPCRKDCDRLNSLTLSHHHHHHKSRSNQAEISTRSAQIYEPFRTADTTSTKVSSYMVQLSPPMQSVERTPHHSKRQLRSPVHELYDQSEMVDLNRHQTLRNGVSISSEAVSSHNIHQVTRSTRELTPTPSQPTTPIAKYRATTFINICTTSNPNQIVSNEASIHL